MNPWHDHAQVDIEEAGRALGHDFHTMTQIPKQSDWPAAVGTGFDAAAHLHRSGHGHRRPHADRFTRKWLQLRLNAWRRQRAVAADVTPQLLRELDVTRCPVTREVLTHGALRDTDWSVDRLNNDAAYAASNLAVMSVRANRAKGALSFAQVMARAQTAHPAHTAEASEGLTPAEWLRLAALMLGPCHATRPHEAPALPLCAPLPVHAVRLALQQVQRLLTEHCLRQAGKNRLLRDFGSACRSDAARLRLAALGHAVHEGLKHTEAHGQGDHRWDVWLQPAVMTALLRWHEALSEAEWARVAALSGRLSQARRETPERLRLWQMPTRGFVPLHTGWA